MLRFVLSVAGGLAASLGSVSAQDGSIAADLPELRVVLNGVETVISRHASDDGDLPMCPPDCVQPIRAAEGVATLGALEVIAVLRDEVATGSGLLVDVRLPQEFTASHLPGAVNVPAVTLAPQNPALRAILSAFGAAETTDGLDFAGMRTLTIYGAGPNLAEAARAVQSLVAAGVPAEKLRYFRGGLQEWVQFGLTVSNPAQEG